MVLLTNYQKLLVFNFEGKRATKYNEEDVKNEKMIIEQKRGELFLILKNYLSKLKNNALIEFKNSKIILLCRSK